jgi:hypothetical protein
VNGAEGSDRATANFRASPGYQYTVDQALDGVMRKASATGQLASGNTDAALLDRAHNLADQEYNTYTGRLSDIGHTGYSAAGSMASLDKGIGDLGVAQGRETAGIFDANGARRASLYGDAGKATAGVYSGDAAARAGLEDSFGKGTATVYGNTGATKAGIYSGTGSSLANLDLGLASSGVAALGRTGQQMIDASNSAFRAGDDASKNAWGLGMGLAGLRASLGGAYLGGGRTLNLSSLGLVPPSRTGDPVFGGI